MEDIYILRPAVFADAPVLVKHRRGMSEEIIRLRGESPDLTSLAAAEEAYLEYLRVHMADGSLEAWVVECQGEIVASGAVSFLAGPPGFWNLTGIDAYVHSIYTVPQHRKNGLARRVVETQINFCREHGLRMMSLHASEAGKSIYEALGFKPRSNEMVLRLD
jgi:GNAT superfamily N-acetyltransferase